MGLHATWTVWAQGDPQRFLLAITQKSPRSAWELGWIGVDLFFVLSGFLITRILLRRSSNLNLGRFYRRRALRILPLYTFTLLLAFGLGPLLPGALAHPTEGLDAWRFLTFTHNLTQQPFTSWMLTPSWSLGVEAHFYLLWPLLIFALRGPRLGAALLAIIALSPALKFAALSAFPVEGLIYHVSLFRFDDFAAGGLVAWAMAHPERVPPARLAMLCRLLSPLALVGAVTLISVAPVAPLLGVHHPTLAVSAFSLLALGFAGWVGWAAVGGGPGFTSC